jgi:hypothetical protein
LSVSHQRFSLPPAPVSGYDGFNSNLEITDSPVAASAGLFFYLDFSFFLPRRAVAALRG